MLQTIREYTHGWIAGTIITIIILSFALWGIHSYFVASADTSTVAVVNGTDISREQLSQTYERLRRQVLAQNHASVIKDETALKNRALKLLVEFEVLKQASLKQGFNIFNNQIDSYLQTMPEFQVDGQFSMDRFQQILSSSMLSTGGFIDLVRSNLLVDQPRLGIMLTSFALPDETNYVASLVNQERDVEYMNIPTDYFLSQPMTISADKIKAYYDQHQNEFMTPEQVSIEYVQLSLKDIAAKITPTDTALKAMYDENVNAYIQPKAWKLTDIKIPLAANASADDVSKAQALATATLLALQTGGDIAKYEVTYPNKGLSQQGYVALNQIPDELQKTVASLSAGQLSQPIRTNDGIVIVKVFDVRQASSQSFDQVKDKVKENYIRQHAEEKFSELRDQLANDTYEHPDSLQSAAKSLGLTIQSSQLFTKDKGANDISQDKKIRDVAFSNDVLNSQNNSDVIQLDPQTAVVIRDKSHVASFVLSLKDVSSLIEDKLKTQAADEKAASVAKEIQTKLQAGTDPTTVASQYNFTWTQAGSIGRYSNKVDSAVLDTAFSLPNPSINNNKPVYGQTRQRSGYAVVGVKSVKPGTLDPKQQSVFADQVQSSEGTLEYELYKRSLMQKAKVKATAIQ